MADEIEVPLEHVQENIKEFHEKHHQPPEHHTAHEDESGEHEEPEKGWSRFIAVFTALLAVIAAIGALQSGLLVNESLLQKNEQIGHLTEASDAWNYYQAEGIKALTYQTAAQLLPPGSAVQKDDLRQAAHYKEKQEAIKTQAEQLTDKAKKESLASSRFLSRHHLFAFSVSFCQIAIAMSAVAALTKRRSVWIFGVCSGIVGSLLLIYGFLH